MATTNLGRVRFRPRGDYNPAPDPLYSLLDLVSYGGGSFVYINDTPSNEPTSSTSHWQQIATMGGQDLVDAAVAARDAAQGYKDAAAASALQLENVGVRIIPYPSSTTEFSLPSTISIMPFDIEIPVQVNRVSVHVTKTHPATLYEVGIYDSNFALVSRSGVKEIILGYNSISVDNVTLPVGRYYFALSILTAKTYVKFKSVKTDKALSAAYVLPLPATITTTFEEGEGVYFEVYSYDLVAPTGFEFTDLVDTRVFAKDTTGGVWGWNTATGKVCKDVGGGFVDLMPVPPGGFWAMEVDMVNGILYTMTALGDIYKSSSLLADATWTNITDTTYKRAHAISLPTSMTLWNGYLWYGEYSASPNELEGGSKIIRYDPVAGTWKLSKLFTDTRHVHSFYVVSAGIMFAMFGDAGSGTNIGYHRLTTSQLKAEEDDAWVKYSTPVSPRTALYNVNTDSATINGVPGLIGSCDQPGTLLTFMKLSDTTIGSANISPLLRSFEDSDSTETVRNVFRDAENNIYFLTAETTKSRLCVSPPPYTQAYILMDTSGFVPGSGTKAVTDGGYTYTSQYKFKHVSFGTTTVTPTARRYVFKDAVVDALTFGNTGSDTLGVQNLTDLYIEASNNVDLASQTAGFYTTAKVDTTAYKRIVVEYDNFDCTGDAKIGVSINASGWDDSAKATLIMLSKHTLCSGEIEVNVEENQGEYNLAVYGVATNLEAQVKLKIKRWYLSKNV